MAGTAAGLITENAPAGNDELLVLPCSLLARLRVRDVLRYPQDGSCSLRSEVRHAAGISNRQRAGVRISIE